MWYLSVAGRGEVREAREEVSATSCACLAELKGVCVRKQTFQLAVDAKECGPLFRPFVQGSCGRGRRHCSSADPRSREILFVSAVPERFIRRLSLTWRHEEAGKSSELMASSSYIRVLRRSSATRRMTGTNQDVASIAP